MESVLVFGLLSVALISTYTANGANVQHSDPFFHTKAGKMHLASMSSKPSSSGGSEKSSVFMPSHGKSGGQREITIGRRNNTDECMADADIILTFDDSSSIKRDDIKNFQRMLTFMQNIVSKFGQVGPNNTRFAAITFSVKVKEHFDLNNFKTKEDIIKGIGKIVPAYGGATHMGDALKYINEKGFRHGRKGVQQIVVVATDGKNNGFESPLYYANKLKKRNVAIIPIGIGSGFLLSELKHIASNEQYVLTTDSFGKLASLIDAVVALACDVCPEKKGTAGAAGKPGRRTFPSIASAPIPPPAPVPPPPPPAPAPIPPPAPVKMHTWGQPTQITGSGQQTWGQQPTQMTGSGQQTWGQQPTQMIGSGQQTWGQQPTHMTGKWQQQSGPSVQSWRHERRQQMPGPSMWSGSRHIPQHQGGMQGWK